MTKGTIRNMSSIHSALFNNRRAKYRAGRSVQLQRKLKSGEWGKPFSEVRMGSETTAQEVADRLNKLNPGSEYRVAQ